MTHHTTPALYALRGTVKGALNNDRLSVIFDNLRAYIALIDAELGRRGCLVKRFNNLGLVLSV